MLLFFEGLIIANATGNDKSYRQNKRNKA